MVNHPVFKRPIFTRRLALAGLFAASLTPAKARNPAANIRNSRKARTAQGDLREAWIFGETSRYRHFVLGDRFEGEGLAARDASGKLHHYTLPDNAVFEDREARLVDLDGDGNNEIAVVVSTQEEGSALALFGLRNGRLVLLDKTPANGQAYRWLNPSGVGHFTQSQHREIAIVRTPHLNGIFETWRFESGKLKRTSRHAGYATHHHGSRHQRLYAVIPKESEGDLLALPTLDRRSIAVLDLTQAKPEIARFPLSDRADGAFQLHRITEGWRLAVPLENGQIDRLVLPRF